MDIRPATEQDIPALLHIGRAFYQYNHYSRLGVSLDTDSLSTVLQQLMASHILLVAVEDGNVVGTVAAYVEPLWWNLETPQATEVFWWLDPPYRNAGNGKQLKDALEAAVRARGVRFLNMIALEASMPEEVEQLYFRNGYTRIERVYLKVLE